MEDPGSSREVADFLILAQGRMALIDIGAQTGFISALFARTRAGATRILSFEPDPQVHALLERARQLNSQPGTAWMIRHEAVSNANETLLMPISNLLHESPDGMAGLGTKIKVQSRTLTEIVRGLDWTPDIIKIDVESFEHEILTAALPLLEKIRPALQLEVHWQLLQSRGLSARDFLSPLADLGYRGIGRRYRGWAEWNRAGQRESVSRLSLLSA
jgi:FkbM family methyltransferase